MVTKCKMQMNVSQHLHHPWSLIPFRSLVLEQMYLLSIWFSSYSCSFGWHSLKLLKDVEYKLKDSGIKDDGDIVPQSELFSYYYYCSLRWTWASWKRYSLPTGEFIECAEFSLNHKWKSRRIKINGFKD